MSTSKFNRAVSSGNSKRMSLVMRNMDYNAYRGLKLSSENTNANKQDLTDLVRQQLKSSNGSGRFPFGLTEERFRWQTCKNIGEKKELNGKLVRRNSDLMSTKGNWQSLMEKTGTIPDTIHLSKNRASSYKYRVEKNSKRTIIPESDSTLDNFDCKRKEEFFNKSTANGSIAKLIEKTPLCEEKYKKFSKKHLEGHDIFTPLPREDKMKLSFPVDMERIKSVGGCAGNFSRPNDDSTKQVPLK